MTIPLPLATDLAAERAHELRAAAKHHRLARLARLARRSRRADRSQPAAGTTRDGDTDRSASLPSAA
ncbi:MAG: hypothetical protein ACRD0A_03955 [Acidimicrobiales bacterium]